ncbi:PREDICTED: uncharacterized protein LOC109468371 [Branchiostoma belcheri]|uniref:Uncharacterized protein LOC109468371 n=1 Tax=Branchiostoma belcheri TaxID=7741 RepID=A0A6P4XZX1_BRABE|nr:PREDICTED: uncharacterized protein LOC109468371 [Branchiostoma belcheri]
MRLTVRALALVVRDGKLNTYVKQSKLWRPGEVWPVVAMVTVGSALCGFVYRTKCYVGQQGRRALTETRHQSLIIAVMREEVCLKRHSEALSDAHYLQDVTMNARPWPLRHGTITNFGAAADVYVDVCPTAPAHIKTWSFRKPKQTTPRKQRQPAARYFTVLRCPLTKYTAGTMPLKLARAAPRLIRDGRLLKYGRPKIWKAGEVWPVIAMVTIGGAFLGMAIRTKSYVGNQGHREHYKHDEEE